MHESVKIIPLFTIALIASIAWFIKPDTIELHSWQTLILFLATISAIMFSIMPMGAIGLLSITLFAITGAAGAVSSKKAIMDALSGFNNELIWLIIIAFFIAKGFLKTGLGERIALLLVRYFGKRTLGLAYALAFADLILSPATPSSTARSGGIIYPITQALARHFNSYPNDQSRHKMGAYLIMCLSHISDITGALFITAYAANPLIVKFASGFGVNLSWSEWFIAASLPVLIAFFFIPIALYFIMKPTIEETLEAPLFALTALKEKGTLCLNEIIMLITFFGLLALWIFGSFLNLHATTSALIALSVLMITGVLTWDDIKGEKNAWDTLIWLCALLMMAEFLHKLGFTKWFGAIIGEQLYVINSMHWIFILVALNAIYIYIHYFFASGIAQVAALYVVFLSVGTTLGIPIYPLALLLGFSSSLYGSLTPYTHTRGVILFESGYVSQKEWLRAGFMINLMNQFIFIVVGLAWWKMVGFY
ncbi:DASS family sodium-coupled anion symporter [Sulfurospirillum deleyianum]|uniref:Anion transporter n=1 Tax=Sulfurospirillum deleyianum (strain ATCC 51133 / DSM 6946 / 5175) TaxID=525898 RepID=D1B0A4_SULD5|nr:DASS family sodium-coupled anion symporter [Sulfurospirillum deleyianum]ACZ11721.1 anion transporter [Sulfurospirillum deleyianum DSM 6946]